MYHICVNICILDVEAYVGTYIYKAVYMPIYTFIYIEKFKTYNITAEVREVA